jgi:hypothetical protein
MDIGIGIYGYGEVGRAVERLISDSHKFPGWYIEDPLIPKQELPYDLDIIHICFPYSDNFISNVLKIVTNPKCLTIIHSTIPIGTTQRIGELIGPTVHVPVRGTHPNLAEYMKNFVAFVGYDNEMAGMLAQGYLSRLGLKCELVKGSNNTEAGKLLDTLYYGMCIEFHRLINKVCDKFDLDEFVVGTRFNQTYNEGYKLIKPNVIRPVLTSPKGKIGGHCILPNTEILDEQIDSWIIKGILEENKE